MVGVADEGVHGCRDEGRDHDGGHEFGSTPSNFLLPTAMAHVVTPLDQPSNYKDSQARLDRQTQNDLLSKSSTLYVSLCRSWVQAFRVDADLLLRAALLVRTEVKGYGLMVWFTLHTDLGLRRLSKKSGNQSINECAVRCWKGYLLTLIVGILLRSEVLNSLKGFVLNELKIWNKNRRRSNFVLNWIWVSEKKD